MTFCLGWPEDLKPNESTVVVVAQCVNETAGFLQGCHHLRIAPVCVEPHCFGSVCSESHPREDQDLVGELEKVYLHVPEEAVNQVSKKEKESDFEVAEDLIETDVRLVDLTPAFQRALVYGLLMDLFVDGRRLFEGYTLAAFGLSHQRL